MRTLVVHTGGVGDFLLFCPTLQQLARDQVELAGTEERLAIAVDAGFARAAMSLDAIDFASVFSVPSDMLRTILRDFDRVIVWMRDESGELAATIRGCGVARVECFPGIPPNDWNIHASAWYAHCLRLPAPPPLRLPVEPAAAQLDVVVHPGSGGRSKNWPIERFKELAIVLGMQGRDVTWSLGPAEQENALNSSLAPALDPMSLTRLARHLAAARIYIGNDSGITHLAAAVGCPTIAIFGPTDPQVWAPQGNHVHVLHRSSEWPSVEEVIQAVRVAD